MDKKVLFISPDFFDYQVSIAEELKTLGYHVKWYSDRPAGGFLVKALIRLNKKIMSRRINKYFKTILTDVKKNNYDYVFVILGQSFNYEKFKELKENSSGAKFIYYAWDSIKNFPIIDEVLPLFDIKFSFDKTDCENKPDLNFLPLFYDRTFQPDDMTNPIYDLCYVGTIKPGKYQLLRSMLSKLEEKYHNNNIYFFIQSKLVWRYYKLKKQEFKGSKASEFKYKRLSKKTVAEMMRKSKIILDTPQQYQLGLTMRTFETLGIKRKLITSNPSIRDYDFYREENIYVYEENKGFDFSNIFFNSEYIEIGKDLYTKYSLNNWVKKIFIGGKPE